MAGVNLWLPLSCVVVVMIVLCKSASFGRCWSMFLFLTIVVACSLLLIVILASRAFLGIHKSKFIVSTSFMFLVRLELGFPESLYIVYWSSLCLGIMCDASYLLTCIFFKLSNCFCFIKCEAWPLFDALFYQFCRLEPKHKYISC